MRLLGRIYSRRRLSEPRRQVEPCIFFLELKGKWWHQPMTNRDVDHLVPDDCDSPD